MMTGDPFSTNIPNNFIVIDDDSINNIVSKFTILRYNKDAEIQLFNNPELALEVIREIISQEDHQRNMVILLDINMPIMSGWEFLDEFAELGNAVNNRFSFYMLSSSIDDTDMEKSEKHELVSGFFSKPLTEKHLHVISADFSTVEPEN